MLVEHLRGRDKLHEIGNELDHVRPDRSMPTARNNAATCRRLGRASGRV
jgi:hypothetical protein